MRLELREDGGIQLTLSRRNLLTLLRKLDGHPADSKCTIEGGDDAAGVFVKAEEDDVHYADRPAGRMHPETEMHITAPSTGIG